MTKTRKIILGALVVNLAVLFLPHDVAFYYCGDVDPFQTTNLLAADFIPEEGGFGLLTIFLWLLLGVFYFFPTLFITNLLVWKKSWPFSFAVLGIFLLLTNLGYLYFSAFDTEISNCQHTELAWGGWLFTLIWLPLNFWFIFRAFRSFTDEK